MAWGAAFCLFQTVFYTVRAFASSEAAIDTGLRITLPPECIGQELCFKKPDDYPIEEIDRFARRMQNRWKRHNTEHSAQIVAADTLGDANNCATLYTSVQPFVVTHNNTPHYVVQSRFLSQTFQIATCKPENTRCFQDFLLPQVKTNCITKYFSFFLTTYDPNNSRAKQIESLLPVDCACELDLITID